MAGAVRAANDKQLLLGSPGQRPAPPRSLRSLAWPMGPPMNPQDPIESELE